MCNFSMDTVYQIGERLTLSNTPHYDPRGMLHRGMTV